MRILHVIDHAPPRTSAYTRRVMAILRQQRALGWQTCHLTGGSQAGVSGKAELTSAAAKWHFYRTPAPRTRLERLPLIGSVNVLAQRLEQVVLLTRPDLLHAHSPVENALAALRVGRRHGLPVVFEPHAPAPSSAPGSVWSGAARRRSRSGVAGAAVGNFAMRALEAWAASRAGAVITNSEGMRMRLRHGGIAEGKITLVPDALDLRKYAPLDPAAKRPAHAGAAEEFDGDTPVRIAIALAGSGADEQLELTLAALVQLRRTHSAATLQVMCEPAMFDQVRQAVARHALDGHVALLAASSENQPERPAAPADLVLFPQAARHYVAGVPHKLLEAMARGCLVIAADTPANRSVIEHGRSGMLFTPDDPAALAGALQVMLARRGRWPAMRAAARWYIEYHRTWEICAARYGPVYERLLAGRRRR